jgi:hypothetical protein
MATNVPVLPSPVPSSPVPDYSATVDGSTKIWRLTLFESMICVSIFLSVLILGFLAGAG